MFSEEVAGLLRAAGHETAHVAELGLRAAADTDLLNLAATQSRVVVTENAADFLPLLDERIAAGVEVTPVLIVLKSNLPHDAHAMIRALAAKLAAWADQHTDPYHYVHWLA